ncbi:hypothetical protein DPMN_144682 [Dreissena polymorpha]|uniref:Uncharacterized protein n=1 Tax=Dreissena polymorpha TaxID=45954 RepID=A0A9D4F3N7_DREPO|nr:hypothetical protein DPMN_144682 [Dreissena polymorpha]
MCQGCNRLSRTLQPTNQKGTSFHSNSRRLWYTLPRDCAIKVNRHRNSSRSTSDIFSRVGLPNETLTDVGKQFVSDLMKEICRLLDMKKLTPIPPAIQWSS